MAERTVRTRWDSGLRAVTQAGNFEVVVDEPERSGGTDTGPQPTDLLLVSVSSCIALALAWVARRRGVDLLGLDLVG
jgi:putative redox protein